MYTSLFFFPANFSPSPPGPFFQNSIYKFTCVLYPVSFHHRVSKKIKKERVSALFLPSPKFGWWRRKIASGFIEVFRFIPLPFTSPSLPFYPLFSRFLYKVLNNVVGWKHDGTSVGREYSNENDVRLRIFFLKKTQKSKSNDTKALHSGSFIWTRCNSLHQLSCARELGGRRNWHSSADQNMNILLLLIVLLKSAARSRPVHLILSWRVSSYFIL